MGLEEEFIARYSASTMPYASEIIASLRDGSGRVVFGPDRFFHTNVRALLHVYEVRASRIPHNATGHFARLRENTLALCDELRLHRGTATRGWSIDRAPHFHFFVLEWAHNQSLVGCLKLVLHTR